MSTIRRVQSAPGRRRWRRATTVPRGVAGRRRTRVTSKVSRNSRGSARQTSRRDPPKVLTFDRRATPRNRYHPFADGFLDSTLAPLAPRGKSPVSLSPRDPSAHATYGRDARTVDGTAAKFKRHGLSRAYSKEGGNEASDGRECRRTRYNVDAERSGSLYIDTHRYNARQHSIRSHNTFTTT